jgi:3-mercaptopyruvate sulfurtransferase SseA
MRKTAVLFAIAIVAGAASAQMKTSTQPPSPIQISGPKLQPQPEPPLESARRVDRDAAMKMVKAGKAVYVDVRSRESYNEGHIPGAISIPLSEVLVRLKDLPPKKEIITYCA